MNEYDIEQAIAAIEEELIASMMRNMERHKRWETDEGFQWSMWQAEQLKSLEKYKRQNSKKFQRKFNEINGSIKQLIEEARKQGNMDQELEILDAIQNGWKPSRRLSGDMATSAEFFRLNTRKLEALIKATENDFKKAETAMLRMANDQYRQVIFNAQVYANTGAGTYEKAVDMATRDFRARGINCIEYKNGARHTMKDYARMAIRTASKRAYLTGEGEKRQEWGISTVIMNKRGNPCPMCLPFVGKIMIDDVWSGGEQNDGPYPLMSSAIAAGLYHPNCKDSHSTYFPGITTAEDKFTKGELVKIEKEYQREQRQKYKERQIEKYEQLALFCLDPENKKKYISMADQWRRKKTLNHADFDIKPYEDGKDITNERKELFKVLNILPTRILNAAKGQTKFVVGRYNSCKYDMDNDIMHIAFKAEPYMIIHEFGHLLEKKMIGEARAHQFKKDAFENITLWNIDKKSFYDMVKNKYDRTLIKDPRFISDYQGVILIEEPVDCFDENMDLRVDRMTEYFSDGFREFIENPNNLKAHDAKLFEFIQEIINEKD